MKVDIDFDNIDKAGFDKFLRKQDYTASNNQAISRYKSLRDIKGGMLSNNAKLYMGSNQMLFDGKGVKQVVNDGVNDRVLIGKQQDGSYGINISYPQSSVNTKYTFNNQFTSNNETGWQSIDPRVIGTITAETPGSYGFIQIDKSEHPDVQTQKFVPGSKLRLTQDGIEKFFYVLGYADWDNGPGHECLAIRGEVSTEFVSNPSLIVNRRLTTSTITSINYSNLLAPYDFPRTMPYAALYSGDSQSDDIDSPGTVTSTSSLNASYNIIGSLVQVFMRYTVSTTSSNSFIELRLPTPILNGAISIDNSDIYNTTTDIDIGGNHETAYIEQSTMTITGGEALSAKLNLHSGDVPSGSTISGTVFLTYEIIPSFTDEGYSFS